jgi:hypothetical protein
MKDLGFSCSLDDNRCPSWRPRNKYTAIFDQKKDKKIFQLCFFSSVLVNQNQDPNPDRIWIRI